MTQTPPPTPTTPGLREVLRGFREISEAIGKDSDLDFVLHLVARHITRLLGVRRCSIYLRATPGGLFRGQVAETGSDQDHMVKRLTCGGPADRFTREILATMRSVLLTDAQTDPRPVRSTMRDWNVKAMLGVPMVVDGQVFGLLFLDNFEQDYDFSPDRQELAAGFADLAGITISQAIQSRRSERRVAALERHRNVLQRVRQIDDRLSSLALDSASIQEVARAVALLTDKGVAIHGADARIHGLASGVAQDTATLRILDPAYRRTPAIAAAIDALPARRPTIVGPFPRAGIAERAMITRVTAGGEDLGYVVVAETRGRFSAEDSAAAERAAMVVAFRLLSHKRSEDVERLAREIVVRDLIGGTEDAHALGARAATLRLDVDVPMVVAVFHPTEVGQQGFTAPDLVTAEATMRRTEDVGATIVDRDLLVAVLAAHDPAALPQVVGRIRDALAARGPHVIAVTSTVFRGTAECPAVYEEARTLALAEAARGASDESRTIAAAELGVERLFLDPAQHAAAERFAQRTLEPLLELGERSAVILETLRAFYAAAQSTRRAAEALGVHENTVRYRLRRAEEILDMRITTDPDHRLAVHFALARTGGVGRRTASVG